MPKVLLTAEKIAQLPAPHPDGKQVIYWDEVVRGFGVAVSGRTNKKSFVVQHDLPGGIARRLTIGSIDRLSFHDACERAGGLLAGMQHGIDPKKKIRQQKRGGKYSVVYFIKIGEAVKIGVTTRIERRFSTLRNGSSEQHAYILALLPGGRSLEKYIHSLLSAARIKNEFFKAEAVIKFLSTIRVFIETRKRS
jgi:hypothetical protein